MTLPEHLKTLVKQQNYQEIDEQIKLLTQPDGKIFKALALFRSFNEIEYIISLRESKNEWEEDGIWHDDGSRKLAFSLSLTLDPPEGGVLEIRRKGDRDSFKITTPTYGEMIVFSTGVEGYEHKINQVTKGSRLIAAGWCS